MDPRDQLRTLIKLGRRYLYLLRCDSSTARWREDKQVQGYSSLQKTLLRKEEKEERREVAKDRRGVTEVEI